MLLAMLLLTGASFAQSCYNVVGYYPSWVAGGPYYINTPSKIDYSKYTHICYAFAIPGSDGNIGGVDGGSTLTDLVNRSHAANVKVLLSIGGWLTSSPSNTPFETIASNTASINRLADACVRLVNQYNLDGIDLDWEYPTTKARWNALSGVLASRLHGMGKLFTAAVAESAFYGDNYDNMSGVDLVNIMCYGPYSMANDAMAYWTRRGVPKERRMLGVPFYSGDNNTAEHIQKSNLAKSTGAGIMIWDIASEYGDINAIYNTLGNVCNGATPVPANLALGKAVTASSTEDATKYPASYAVDNSYGTRWSSTFTDLQWIYVDLGATYSVNRVKITWEAAYATAYQVQTSNDPSNANGWTTIKNVTGNTALTNDNTGLTGSGRYVRIYATSRATAYGYSIFALEVYGSQVDNQAPAAPANLRSTGATSTTASLAWNAATDNIGVTGYDVYKDGVFLASVTGTTYTATGLTVNTSYSFTVKAKDAAGNVSAASTAVQVSTVNNLALNKPVTVSSTETADFPATNAVDGSTTTRWSSLYVDPTWIYVDLGATYNINRVKTTWETAFATAYQIQVSNDASNANGWSTIYSTTTNTGGVNDIPVSGTGRYVRIYGTARSTEYGYSLWELEVYGTAATSQPQVNLALNKPGVASSLEDNTLPASLAFDGNTTTRWASLEGIDPQFIYVDLGATYAINRVKLTWENAYAKAYTIQVSDDASIWSDVSSTTTGDGGTDDVSFTAANGRYVRIYGTARGTTYGYSLYEFEVYGTEVAATVSLMAFPNPTKESLTVGMKGAAAGSRFTIVNSANGKVAYTGVIVEADQNVLVNTSSWSKGIYILSFENNKKQERIVIE